MPPKPQTGTATQCAGAVTEFGSEPTLDKIRQETAANHQVFVGLRVGFAHHEGEYALMKERAIVDFFTDRRSALLAGNERFPDGLFSVHRVLANDRRQSDAAAPLERRQSTV